MYIHRCTYWHIDRAAWFRHPPHSIVSHYAPGEINFELIIDHPVYYQYMYLGTAVTVLRWGSLIRVHACTLDPICLRFAWPPPFLITPLWGDRFTALQRNYTHINRSLFTTHVRRLLIIYGIDIDFSRLDIIMVAHSLAVTSFIPCQAALYVCITLLDGFSLPVWFSLLCTF